MPLDVGYGKQRLFPCISECFCKVHPHEQCAEQSRSVRDGNGVDIVLCHICGKKRFFDYVLYCKRMVSACDFGYDSAKSSVDFNLRRNDVGHDFSAVSHDCASGLVATRLDCKHRKIFFVLQTIHSNHAYYVLLLN